MHVQLLHDAAAVGVDGVHAEIQGDGDFFVGFALGEQNFALAAAEPVDGVGDVLAIIVEDGDTRWPRRGDRCILEESAREMVWILEGRDRPEEVRRMEYRRATQWVDQMALPIPVTAPAASQLAPEAAVAETKERVRMPRPEQYSLILVSRSWR